MSTNIFLSLLLLLISSAAANHQLKIRYKATYYFHDILYNGNNSGNATAAIVGTPPWGNTTNLAGKNNHFGSMVVFNDPITRDNNLHSPPIGRAQGMYFYDGTNDVLSSWLGFTFVFNSSDKHEMGTISFNGADPIMDTTRDISIVGGTGNFTMARGIATLSTDTYEGEVYFRLRVDVKLYEYYGNGTNWN